MQANPWLNITFKLCFLKFRELYYFKHNATDCNVVVALQRFEFCGDTTVVYILPTLIRCLVLHITITC